MSDAAVPSVGPGFAKPRLRVLYVSHTAVVSGAEWSLLELLHGVRGDVDPCLACPEGELAVLARELGVPVEVIRPVELSFRLSGRRTLLGFARLPLVALEIRRVARAFQADLVHANSMRAGLAAITARAIGAPRPIVHVRDAIPAGMAGRLVAAFLCRGASLVLANSRFTASKLGPTGHGRVQVLFNAVDLDRFGARNGGRRRVRNELGISPATPVLGVVAQLTPWKAQDDAIRILARVREGFDDAQLLLVGEAKFQDGFTRYDNAAYARELRQLASELGVAEAVRFVGERRDVPDVLNAIDVLLVPSWEEPFGRAVAEAMATGVPVVATAIGGPAELIEDGKSGLLLPPREPDRWAATVVGLLEDAGRRQLLRAGARAAVTTFGREEHAAAIVARYRRTLCTDGRGSGVRTSPARSADAVGR
jgi:glycosyltransferase involved in cell wall biosynthesis